jgi:hypothetical protein
VPSNRKDAGWRKSAPGSLSEPRRWDDRPAWTRLGDTGHLRPLRRARRTTTARSGDHIEDRFKHGANAAYARTGSTRTSSGLAFNADFLLLVGPLRRQEERFRERAPAQLDGLGQWAYGVFLLWHGVHQNGFDAFYLRSTEREPTGNPTSHPWRSSPAGTCTHAPSSPDAGSTPCLWARTTRRLSASGYAPA